MNIISEILLYITLLIWVLLSLPFWLIFWALGSIVSKRFPH